MNLWYRIKDTLLDWHDRIMYRIAGDEELELPVGKIILIAVSSVILIIGGFFVVRKLFFSGGDDERQEQVAQVRVQRIKKENFTEKYAVMGTIRGTVENDMRFEIEGTLARYNFPEGARIGRGAIIASLDPKDSLSKASYAKSKYNSEKASYFSAAQRMKVYGELFKMKAISETKFEEAKYETDSAKERMDAALSELELAQSNLEKTNLFAPSSGVLAERLIQAGEFVTPHDVVAKFISGGEVNFEVDVPEKDVEKVKIGMKVKINCDAYQDKDFWGKVKEIAPTVKEKTRTTIVKIEIPNDDGQLRSGMFARGDIFFLEMPDTITIPQDSLISLGAETKLVPKVKPDPSVPNRGMVELRSITAGQTVSRSIIVQDGLSENELVVIETQTQLSDGLPVQFTEVNPTGNETVR